MDEETVENADDRSTKLRIVGAENVCKNSASDAKGYAHLCAHGGGTQSANSLGSVLGRQGGGACTESPARHVAILILLHFSVHFT